MITKIVNQTFLKLETTFKIIEAKVNPATKFGSVLVRSCTVVYICFKGMHCELRTETSKLFDKDKQIGA